MSAAPSYSAAFTLHSISPSVGSTDAGTLVLTNPGSTPANAALTLALPSGFGTNNVVNACGGSLTSNGANLLSLAGATVPPGGSCSFALTLTVPTVNLLPPSGQTAFSIASAGGPGNAVLASASVPAVTLLGATPGMYSDLWFPSALAYVSVLDMVVTPENDPGPDSNVFWSNQMGALNGYTGMQSTELVSAAEGSGKQFLFSLWGATNAAPGTPASAGIGAGSFCTVSGTATDGTAGAQCRYRYEWQVGHSYRFRVTANAALGPGWFKSNVTDTTAGSAGDSFDIGSIYVGSSATAVPVSYVSQWTEYFDWNSDRTSCLSPAYAAAQFSVSALNTAGQVVALASPNAYANTSCPSNASHVAYAQGVTTEQGEPLQTAQGLFKANGLCLTAAAGLTDGNPVGSNMAVLGTCPTLLSVRAHGGSAFAPSLWVFASDGSIQTRLSYCLTATTGGAVAVQTCVPGASNQQWRTVAGSPAQQLVQAGTGQCLVANGTNVSLGACTGSSGMWTVPGTSFAY